MNKSFLAKILLTVKNNSNYFNVNWKICPSITIISLEEIDTGEAGIGWVVSELIMLDNNF